MVAHVAGERPAGSAEGRRVVRATADQHSLGRTRPPLPKGSKLRVITIGINKYDRSLTGLDDFPAVAKSVSALRQFFTRQRAAQHTYSDIVVSPEPTDRTRQGILDYLESTLRETSGRRRAPVSCGARLEPAGSKPVLPRAHEGRDRLVEAVRRTAISSLDLVELHSPLEVASADSCRGRVSVGRGIRTSTRIADAQVQLQEFRARLGSTDPNAPSNGLGYLLASASPIKITQLPTAGPSLLARALIDGWRDAALMGRARFSAS